MTIASRFRHARYGHFSRQRYAKRLLAFLSAQGTRLTSSATAQTIVPVHVSNVYATDVLTITGNPTNNQTVSIGGRVYTYKTALTEVKATGRLTFTGNPADNDTVTIGATVYRIKDTPAQAYDVQRDGTTAATTRTHLRHAISADGTGADYFAGTVVHPDVTAADNSTDKLDVTAKIPGMAGNAIATSRTGTFGTFGATTLTTGVNPVVNELFIGAANTDSIDNIVAAINTGGGAGTKYSTGTTTNTDVSAGARVGNTTTVTALALGGLGNLVHVLATAGSWASGTLLGGVTETWGPTVTATGHGISTGEGPYLITSSNGPTHVPAGYTVGDFLYVGVVDADTVKLYRDAGLTELQTYTGAGTGTISLKKGLTKAAVYDLLKRNSSETVVGIADIDNLR